MLPSASIGFATMSPALMKDIENKRYQKFTIIQKEETPLVVDSVSQLKNEQRIAGMAFRFFGLHNMPVYKANTAFLKRVSTYGLPTQATELLLGLQNYNDMVREGRIYNNNVSKYKSDLTIDQMYSNILCYSIATPVKDIVLVYNTSLSEAYENFILLNNPRLNECNFLEVIYGYDTSSYIQVFRSLFDNISKSYIRLYLKPLQLVILRNHGVKNI